MPSLKLKQNALLHIENFLFLYYMVEFFLHLKMGKGKIKMVELEG